MDNLKNKTVDYFLKQLENTVSLENIIKLQNMDYEESSTMIIDHFKRFKSSELTSEDIKCILDKINSINATEILEEFSSNNTVKVVLEEITYDSEYLQLINLSLEKFIAYASTYKYEEKPSGTYKSEYNRYLDLAVHLRRNLHNVALHVHKHCFSHKEVVFPNLTLKCLYNYRNFCYKDTYHNPELTFNSLEEQNEATKYYVHYDFSVTKIKTLT